MTEYKVGDRVKFVEDYNKSRETRAVRAGEVATVRGYVRDGLVSVDLLGDPARQRVHVFSRRLERVEPFAKGDKVVAVDGNDNLGIRTGVVYTVAAVHTDSHGTIVNVESASGRRAWGDVKRFKQYVPKQQGFELRNGDKVKNVKTGRVGEVLPGPLSGVLKVYDVRPPYRDGVPASALEEYEDHYPGTYELVNRKEPW